MSKHKYIYNPNTLNYEKINLTFRDHLKRTTSFIITGLVFASIIIFVAYTFFHSPKEIRLMRENDQLKVQYQLINRDLNELENVLGDIQHRDDNIYRVIFEADPVSPSVREAGVGGVNRYSNLEGFEYSDLVVQTRKKLDNISRKLVVQSKSFDAVVDLAKGKEDMLRSIPAIQPIYNPDLTRMASGFGYRIHPIYKRRKMHTGADFTAPTGTPIYATGDGVVYKVVSSKRGYGNHIVIQHDFGYQTLYAHMFKFNVRKGQKVKRTDVIGYVGSTGTSTAPHLHYEVVKNGKKVNPINFFVNDLNPEQLDQLYKRSINQNQSFD
jgi:murein DD-endopeptidase MepM/ murein hydrolase activator NlpD